MDQHQLESYTNNLRNLKNVPHSVKHLRLSTFIKLLEGRHMNGWPDNLEALRSRYKDSIRGDQLWEHVLEIFVGVVYLTDMDQEYEYPLTRLYSIAYAAMRYVENCYEHLKRPIPYSGESISSNHLIERISGLSDLLEEGSADLLLRAEESVFGDVVYTNLGVRKRTSATTYGGVDQLPDNLTPGQHAVIDVGTPQTEFLSPGTYEKVLAHPDGLKAAIDTLRAPTEPPEPPKVFEWSEKDPEWYWEVRDRDPEVVPMTAQLSSTIFARNMRDGMWIHAQPDINRIYTRYNFPVGEEVQRMGLWQRFITIYKNVMDGLNMNRSMTYFGVHLVVLEEAVTRAESDWVNEFGPLPFMADVGFLPQARTRNELVHHIQHVVAMLNTQKVLEAKNSKEAPAENNDVSSPLAVYEKHDLVSKGKFMQLILSTTSLENQPELAVLTKRYKTESVTFGPFWRSAVSRFEVLLSQPLLTRSNLVYFGEYIVLLKEALANTEELWKLAKPTALPTRITFPPLTSLGSELTRMIDEMSRYCAEQRKKLGLESAWPLPVAPVIVEKKTTVEIEQSELDLLKKHRQEDADAVTRFKDSSSKMAAHSVARAVLIVLYKTDLLASLREVTPAQHKFETIFELVLDWVMSRMKKEECVELIEGTQTTEVIGMLAMLQMKAIESVEIHTDSDERETFLVKAAYFGYKFTFRAKGPILQYIRKLLRTETVWTDSERGDGVKYARFGFALNEREPVHSLRIYHYPQAAGH